MKTVVHHHVGIKFNLQKNAQSFTYYFTLSLRLRPNE